MSKFQKGDLVRRTRDSLSFDAAAIYTVTVVGSFLDNTPKIQVKEVQGNWSGEYFELVIVRPHRDLIIAWANGAIIEIEFSDGDWGVVDNPSFYDSRTYRVKPAIPVDPNALEIARIEKEMRVLADDLGKLKKS